ncbi:MAG: NifB/NifX family molybdenum-iron cluster-binding protein [Propionibacteriaceae bacterium]|nr:NifB/NifX family molybdenum-iron cluster-binding protein [Propionibacteriaceae bacterium]
MTSPDAVIAINLDGSEIGGGWGRARRVALATAAAGAITGWTETDVGWDVAHDQGPHGSHHARIVRFLRDHGVSVVVTGHMGPPMERMLRTMGIAAVVGVAGDARAVARALAAHLTPDEAPATPPDPPAVAPSTDLAAIAPDTGLTAAGPAGASSR